jgi:hypothetical protein
MSNFGSFSEMHYRKRITQPKVKEDLMRSGILGTAGSGYSLPSKTTDTQL